MKKFLSVLCTAFVTFSAVFYIENTAFAVTAQPSYSKISVEGNNIDIKAYNIGGNNYFKLRDIADAVGFQVSWDITSQTIIINCGETTDDTININTSVSVKKVHAVSARNSYTAAIKSDSTVGIGIGAATDSAETTRQQTKM